MKRFASFFTVALMLAGLLFNAAPVSAATSSGLSIPPRKDFKIEAGSSVSDKMIITNLNRELDLTLSIRVIDFSFSDDTGTPKLMLDENAPQTTWSLKPFITLPKSLVVPAGKSSSFDYKVSIPKEQGAGSYYSAVIFGSGAGDGGNVNLSASGVSLVFVSVPGIVDEDMKLTKLGAYASNENTAGGNFVNVAVDKPKQIGVRLQNNGNVFESPAGSITLKHMFGNEILIDKINPSQSLALIGQDRLFLSCIEPIEEEVEVAGNQTERTVCNSPSLWPGRYTINLSAFYGQNGNETNEISGTATFWYIPVWFIGALLALIGFVVYTVWRIRRKLYQKSQGNTPKRYRKQ